MTDTWGILLQDKLQKLLDSEEFVNRGIVVESYPFNKELGQTVLCCLSLFYPTAPIPQFSQEIEEP